MLTSLLRVPLDYPLITLGLTLFLIIFLPSIIVIGPTQVGLVMRRFGKRIRDDNPVSLHGEAGYQADLLMPGFRFKLWFLFRVDKYPWVQVPAGEIGVVVAQVGEPLAIGAKSAVYKSEFGNFTDVRRFLTSGGQKGVQRPVLSPGTLAPIHPISFLVITRERVYGMPISRDLQRRAARMGGLTPESFGLTPEQLELTRIAPQVQATTGKLTDVIGVITTLEGDPLPPGQIAGRLGGFEDVEQMERNGGNDQEMIEALLANKNSLHNNYQDFQAFVDNGGRIGLQYDPLLYGAYALNPFLVKVDLSPMLMIRQGEVAVVKAFVGLTTQDTSGTDFKHGALVRPGHRGIWQEPLRTGKYPINPRCYQCEIVPTAILTLNWADAVSQAHQLDAHLQQIVAKSKEGFVFKLDLQVQIHVPDTKAPKVISMVGTMQNLVNEVLQAAVGNHFRNKLQSMPAVSFIEMRQQVQEQAYLYIQEQLSRYVVETLGVYIQDVVFPEDMVEVLQQREIANQEIETFKMQRSAQEERIEMEKSKGMADMQADLARSKVGIEIKSNNADARKAEASGEADFIERTGAAQGAEVRAVGLARAEGYERQVKALGPMPTALVNIAAMLSTSKTRFVPDILVTGGGGSIEALAATLLKQVSGNVGIGQAEGTDPATAPVEHHDGPGTGEAIPEHKA